VNALNLANSVKEAAVDIKQEIQVAVDLATIAAVKAISRTFLENEFLNINLFRRDCTEPRQQRQGGGSGGGNRACYNCGQDGHMR
jgi:hypothetical protein